MALQYDQISGNYKGSEDYRVHVTFAKENRKPSENIVHGLKDICLDPIIGALMEKEQIFNNAQLLAKPKNMLCAAPASVDNSAIGKIDELIEILDKAPSKANKLTQ